MRKKQNEANKSEWEQSQATEAARRSFSKSQGELHPIEECGRTLL